jgi:ubiquinone/menaquinone biosynthesis C-methylase UbiE
LSKAKEEKYSDSKIYELVISHPEAIQKHNKYQKQGLCSQYTYTFEKLALVLLNKYLNIENKSNIKYLDVACGNGSKTKLFSDKLGLVGKNVYGTDIDEWGPYKSEKSKLPIQFKLLENNKLDFADNEFDILSIFLALHHIPIDQLPGILNEFKRVLKPEGILIIIEHNILNDFDHLIVDIEHSLNSYIYDKKPDDTFTNYFNYMELDFVLNNYGFYWTYGYQMTANVGFEVRYDNPFYALYKNNKS